MPFIGGKDGLFVPKQDTWANFIVDKDKYEAPESSLEQLSATSPFNARFSQETEDKKSDAQNALAIEACTSVRTPPEVIMREAYHLPCHQRSSGGWQAGNVSKTHHVVAEDVADNELRLFRSIDFPNVKAAKQMMEFLFRPPDDVYVGLQELYRLQQERKAGRRRVDLVSSSHHDDNDNADHGKEEEEEESGDGDLDEEWKNSLSLAVQVASESFPPIDTVDRPLSPDRCYALWRGIRNLGNTCYFNSILQMLSSIAPLRRAILSPTTGAGMESAGREEPSEEDGANGERAIITTGEEIAASTLMKSGLREALAEMAFSRDPNGVNIQSLTQSLGLNPQLQQDAAECFTLLLDWLENSGGSQMKGIIERSLQGSLLYDRRCKVCQRSMKRAETFLYLSTPVCGSLLEGIEKALLPEEVDGYACEGCGKNVGVTSYTYLRHAPPTFCVHLNRFEFDMQLMERRKVNNAVALPLSLDLTDMVNAWSADRSQGSCASSSPPPPRRPAGPFSLQEEEEEYGDGTTTLPSEAKFRAHHRQSDVDDMKQNSVTYELCSILHHHGNSAYSGHYTFSLKVDPEEEPDVYAAHGIPLPPPMGASPASNPNTPPPVFLWRHFNDASVTVTRDITPFPSNSPAIPMGVPSDGKVDPSSLPEENESNGVETVKPITNASVETNPLHGAQAEKKMLHSSSAYMLVYRRRRREVRSHTDPVTNTEQRGVRITSPNEDDPNAAVSMNERRASSVDAQMLRRNAPHPSELPPYLLSYLRRLNAQQQQLSALSHQRFSVCLDFFLRWKNAADDLLGSTMPIPRAPLPPSTEATFRRGKTAVSHVDPAADLGKALSHTRDTHEDDDDDDEDQIFYAVPQEWLAAFGRCFLPLKEVERLQVCLQQVAASARCGYGSSTSSAGYSSCGSSHLAKPVMPLCVPDDTYEPLRACDRPLPYAVRQMMGSQPIHQDEETAIYDAADSDKKQENRVLNARHRALYQDLVWLEKKRKGVSEEEAVSLTPRNALSDTGTPPLVKVPNGNHLKNQNIRRGKRVDVQETKDSDDYEDMPDSTTIPFFTPHQSRISARMVMNLQCPHGKVAPWGLYKVLSQKQLRQVFSAFENRVHEESSICLNDGCKGTEERSREPESENATCYSKPFSEIVRELRLRGLCISDPSSRCATCVGTFAKSVRELAEQTYWDAIALQWCRGKHLKPDRFLAHLKSIQRATTEEDVNSSLLKAGGEEENRVLSPLAPCSFEEATTTVYLNRKLFLIWKTMAERWVLFLRHEKNQEDQHRYTSDIHRATNQVRFKVSIDEDSTNEENPNEDEDFNSIFEWNDNEEDSSPWNLHALSQDEMKMINSICRSLNPDSFTDHVASALGIVSLPPTITDPLESDAAFHSHEEAADGVSSDEEVQEEGEEVIWQELRRINAKRLAAADPSLWVASSDIMLALVKYELGGFPPAPPTHSHRSSHAVANPLSGGMTGRGGGGGDYSGTGSVRNLPNSVTRDGGRRRGAMNVRPPGKSNVAYRRGHGYSLWRTPRNGRQHRGGGASRNFRRSTPLSCMRSLMTSLKTSVSARYRGRWCAHARWREGTPVVAVPAAVAEYIRATVSSAWVSATAFFVALCCERRGDRWNVRDGEDAVGGELPSRGFGFRKTPALATPQIASAPPSGDGKKSLRPHGGGGWKGGRVVGPPKSPPPCSVAEPSKTETSDSHADLNDRGTSAMYCPPLTMMKASELARYMVYLLQTGFFASTDRGSTEDSKSYHHTALTTRDIESVEWDTLSSLVSKEWTHLVNILFQSIPALPQRIYKTTMEEPLPEVSNTSAFNNEKGMANKPDTTGDGKDLYNKPVKNSVHNPDVVDLQTKAEMPDYANPESKEETTHNRPERALYRTQLCQACEQERIKRVMKREKRRFERNWLISVLGTLGKAGCVTSPQYEKLWRDQGCSVGGTDTLPQPHAFARDAHPNNDLLPCSDAVMRDLQVQQKELDSERQRIKHDAEALVRRLEEKLSEMKSGRASGTHRNEVHRMENLNAITIRYAKRGKKGGRGGRRGGADKEGSPSPNSSSVALDASLSSSSASPTSPDPQESFATLDSVSPSTIVEQDLQSARRRLKRIEELMEGGETARKDETDVKETNLPKGPDAEDVVLPPQYAVHRVGCVPTWWVAEWYAIHHQGEGEKTKHLYHITSNSYNTKSTIDQTNEVNNENDDEDDEEEEDEYVGYDQEEGERSGDGDVPAIGHRNAHSLYPSSPQEQLRPPPSLQGVPRRKPFLSYAPFICVHGHTMVDPTWLDPKSSFWDEYGPRRAHLLFSSLILSYSMVNEPLAMRMFGQQKPPAVLRKGNKQVRFCEEDDSLTRGKADQMTLSDEDERLVLDEEEEVLIQVQEESSEPNQDTVVRRQSPELKTTPDAGEGIGRKPMKLLIHDDNDYRSHDSFSSLDVEETGSAGGTSDGSRSRSWENEPRHPVALEKNKYAAAELEEYAGQYWQGLTSNVWEPYLHFYPPLSLLPESELLVVLQHYAPEYLVENTLPKEEKNGVEDQPTAQQTREVKYSIRWDKLPHVQHTLDLQANARTAVQSNNSIKNSNVLLPTRTSLSLPVCTSCRDEVLHQFLHRITFFSGPSSVLRVHLQLRSTKQRQLCAAITEVCGKDSYYDDDNNLLRCSTAIHFRATLGSLRRLLRAHILHKYKIDCPLEDIELYRGTKKKPLKVRLPLCPKEIPQPSSPEFAALLQIASSRTAPSTGFVPLSDFTSLFELGIRDGDVLSLVCDSAVSQYNPGTQWWGNSYNTDKGFPPRNVRVGTVIDQDAFQSTNLSSAGRATTAATTSLAAPPSILSKASKPPNPPSTATAPPPGLNTRSNLNEFVFPDLSDTDPAYPSSLSTAHHALNDFHHAQDDGVTHKTVDNLPFDVIVEEEDEKGIACSVCTFLNASGMRYCEICESPLVF